MEGLGTGVTKGRKQEISSLKLPGCGKALYAYIAAGMNKSCCGNW